MGRTHLTIVIGAVVLVLLIIALACRPVPQADTPGPFFVTPTGSGSSACSEADPCTLTRAVALVNNGTINDCATIVLAPGYYSQAALTISGSGRADCRITFLGNGEAISTGTRVQIPPEQWSLVPGRQYTYVADHDDAVFNSSNPAQRTPTNWQPIYVANNATTTLVLDLDFPPRFINVDSIDKVERQMMTHFDDVAANKVYVHMPDDQAPSWAHDFYLSSTNWGTWTIQGDFLTLDGINLQHSGKSGQNGLHIANSADGFILRHADLRATGITVEGTNGLYEDSRVGYVFLQGETGSSACFDKNPSFGIGECWNRGGGGSAFDVGIDKSPKSFGNVVRRMFVHRSWNGFSLRGDRQTAEDNLFWGFANHTVGFQGRGGIFRRNIMLNGQDSLYSEGNDFDELLVEHNLAHNGTLFWVSRDGKGGTPPTRWVLRQNVFPTLVVDDKTFPALASDCNVVLENMNDPGVDMFRIIGTDAAQGTNRNFNTLADWQTGTGQDLRSLELPSPKWTDGTEFRLFTTQSAPYDFSLVPGAAAAYLTGCGTYAGPNGYGR